MSSLINLFFFFFFNFWFGDMDSLQDMIYLAWTYGSF